MENFRKALDECRLLDLGFERNKFTWSNKFPNGGMVWERLDRVVSTTKWFDLFPAIKVQTLVCVTSNHNLIIILSDGFCVKPQKPWRFEQMWLKNASCHDIVIGTWGMATLGSPMEEVIKKINACKRSSMQWSKHSFLNVSRALFEKKLKEDEVVAVRGKDVEIFLQLKSEINDLLRLEEKMMQQRSHVHWMVPSDRNSKFSQSCLSMILPELDF